ncbi:5'-methylthioadenosine/adenosylhomocysteine nucleosidase [Beduini massiliensis]|uniref:5'-methylthioadenosine/adenosylhomocysteine nucleosidase n=1 Tax=Beduini massiliensis TaxID=1585974 RepID=UPI0006945F86|nr:5'-methylthioadenosine/adenosylhomocysteine nucleosidase [Beduini massiliensis]
MKIGIITALTIEAIDYIKHFGLVEQSDNHGLKIYFGYYKKYEIYLAITSCGKVNAAYCTKHLIDTKQPQCILHSGIAGGIGNNIHPLDLVVAKEVTYHDVDPQQMIEFPPYLSVFQCDKGLVDKTLKHIETMGITAKTGRIISGDSFIADEAKANLLAKTYQAEMVDMESAAIGQVCQLEDIPLLIIRCASDEAGNEAVDTYEENEEKASSQAAQVILSLLDNELL